MKKNSIKSTLLLLSIIVVFVSFGQNLLFISPLIKTTSVTNHKQEFAQATSEDTIIVSSANRAVVNRGSRPPVDFYAIPDSMLYKKHLIVKFHAHLEPLLEVQDFGGLLDLKELNSKWNVESIVSDYDTITYNPKFKERHRKWGLHLWYQINFKDEVVIKEALREYAQYKSLFEIVEPEIILHDFSKNLANTVVTYNDPEFNNQWNYHNSGQTGGTADADIDLPEAWSIESGKKNVIIAILDSGVDTTHTDLKANFWRGANGEKIGYNFYSSSAILNSGNHGTHVAGTIGAVNNNGDRVSSVAGGNGNTNSGVSLMICQVSNAAGSSFSTRAIKRAFIWSADNGAAIAQNSWGTLPPNTYNTEAIDGIDYFIENGGGDVLEKGLVIFSAGNSNLNAKIYPAAYERVIAVAATNHKDVRSSYSSYGSWVDITAPGGEGSSTGRILSTVPMTSNGGKGYLVGTSQASPHVTGVAALVLSKAQGALHSDDVRSILIQESDDISNLNTAYRDLLGRGRLNAHRALLKTQEILGQPIINPVENFSIQYNDCDHISLHWKNDASKTVVIAMNENNKGLMGIPSGNYAVGDYIMAGGGKIIYKGTGNTFTLPISQYYDLLGFKIWFQENENYSKGNFRIINEIAPCSAPVLYVKQGGTGDGSSWGSASGDIQQMIDKAAPGTSIYIAKGTYVPQYIGGNVNNLSAGNRSNYFLLAKRVYLYGGFPDDNNQATLSNRNPSLNTTILSGDFSKNDIVGNVGTMAENSYHVLVTVNVEESKSIVLIDGLTITGGNANSAESTTSIHGIEIPNNNGAGWYNAGSVFLMNNVIITNNIASNFGGGLYNLSGSSTLQNVILSHNKAAKGAGLYNRASNPFLSQCDIQYNQTTGIAGEGGGWYNQADSPSMHNCRVMYNAAVRGGGGYSIGGSPTIVNSIVADNTVTGEGGGIFHIAGKLSLLNVTLSNNYANMQGGGIFSSVASANYLTIGNSILWQNFARTSNAQIRIANASALAASYTIIQDYAVDHQKYIYNFNPEFVNSENGDYRLSNCSPAVNLGENTLLAGMNIEKDMAGSPRVFNTQIDLGSYEFQVKQEPTSLESETVFIQRPIFNGETVLNDGCNFIVKVQNVSSPQGNIFSAEAEVADSKVLNINGWNYVKRYFRIQPAHNAENLFARLTLYFTKEEFDTYNSIYGHANGKSLPENLKVIQFHGTVLEGRQHEYTGGVTTITPNINDIVLNEETGIWQVSFNVYGFSGFYITVQDSPDVALPVTLLKFDAKKVDNYSVSLDWKTAEETNFKHFEIERSIDDFKTFTLIGEVSSKQGAGIRAYTLLDNPPANSIVYYRLKMVDMDNTYTYSDYVSVRWLDSNPLSKVYPNPSTGVFYVDQKWNNAQATVIDLNGNVVWNQKNNGIKLEVDLRHLPTGSYIMQLQKEGQVDVQLIVKE